MRSHPYAVCTVKTKMHPAMTRRHLRRWKRAPVAVVGRNLTKRFRDLEAVGSISFDVPARLSSLTSRLNP